MSSFFTVTPCYIQINQIGGLNSGFHCISVGSVLFGAANEGYVGSGLSGIVSRSGLWVMSGWVENYVSA